MEWYAAGGLLLGSVLIFMALSIPVAFAFLLTNLIGVLIFIGGSGGVEQLVANSTDTVTNFALIAIPLFVLMGELFFHTGIATKVFDVFDKLLGAIPGRLSYLTIGGGTLFAALSGSSMANTALLGSTLLPEMIRRGYKSHVSMGPIIATGSLAILIPPSALGVLLGSLARINIGSLLLAGIVPALLLATMYVVVVFVTVGFDQKAAPRYASERVSLWTMLQLIVTNLMPMGIVIFMVIGFIILGIATPTESAAFGVLGVTVVAALFRALTWRAVTKSLIGAARISGMVFLIILGSTTFSQLLALTGASAGLINWVATLKVSSYLILIAMIIIILFLGMLMESVSIMMLTVPVFFPLARTLGFDPIWFGTLMLISLEVGLATPPFGMGLFVLLGVAPRGTTLIQVSRAVLPYTICSIVLIFLLILFPVLTRLLG